MSVVLTGSPKLAGPDMYLVQHDCFLPKPFSPSDVQLSLLIAITKQMKRLCEQVNPAMGFTGESLCKSRMALWVNGRLEFFETDDIEVIESNGRKVVLYGKTEAEAYATQTQLLSVLPHSFHRCHKSYLVNVNAIASIEQSTLTTVSGRKVPISQRTRQGFLKEVLAHVGHIEH